VRTTTTKQTATDKGGLAAGRRYPSEVDDNTTGGLLLRHYDDQDYNSRRNKNKLPLEYNKNRDVTEWLDPPADEILADTVDQNEMLERHQFELQEHIAIQTNSSS